MTLCKHGSHAVVSVLSFQNRKQWPRWKFVSLCITILIIRMPGSPSAEVLSLQLRV